ncbi:DNA mismatch repair protein MutS [SAR202 cluster bacterium AD-802-E10_MRT_200m]|nr:DNA mismatch repair protein MutS [SAR202 cluster bacterium AD-802-E10_MRT_200m]
MKATSDSNPTELTPLRSQYLSIKKQHPDAIVLFRLGDFYETFDEDARLTAHHLEIVLTSREMGKGNRVPMAGIPHHALEAYLARFMKTGHRVVICEQVSQINSSPGLLEREVVRIVTPGTIVEPTLLDSKCNNFLAAIITDKEEAGIAYADITTSEFAAAQVSIDELGTELERLNPAELLVSTNHKGELQKGTVTLSPNYFDEDEATQCLLHHFNLTNLTSFGCERQPLAIRACGALLHYLKDTRKDALEQLDSLHSYTTNRYMTLDYQTRRNLELFEGGRFGDGPSLLTELDSTKTPMGGRLLRRWLGQPLLDINEIELRLNLVEWLYTTKTCRSNIRKLLTSVSDPERLLNRIRNGSASPKDVSALRQSLETVPKIREIISLGGSKVRWLQEIMPPCPKVVEVIKNAITDDPLAPLGEGRIIRQGYSARLDELNIAAYSIQDTIAKLQTRERQRTGISSLKVGYTRVFGYYLEITNANLDRVPPEYIRRQSLSNAERFITPELKEYESQILTAQHDLEQLEIDLFVDLCQQIGNSSSLILAVSQALAQIDVFASLAECALRNNYVKPTISEGFKLEITGGRHPIVEQSILTGTFVPNDTVLDNDSCSFMLITGPNMAGKSTFIRQVALITLMAQIGSFVPADSADLTVVDRIFTRVGLQDDLATGQSTFMVEMVETASILRNATSKSLVILDEIGRGTSTYDGLAIATAVAEYIHNDPNLGCKTLFATHYHELIELANYLPHIKNFNVAVTEEKGQVRFLHSILPGESTKSYGVHVAQMAGLPEQAIKRAMEIFDLLESTRSSTTLLSDDKEPIPTQTHVESTMNPQLPLRNQVLSELARTFAEIDVQNMTPIQALNKLHELQLKFRDT